MQVLASKLHKLWRRFDRKVMQHLFGGRDVRMPVYFQSVSELNLRIRATPMSPPGAGGHSRFAVEPLPEGDTPTSSIGTPDLPSGVLHLIPALINVCRSRTLHTRWACVLCACSQLKSMQ